MIVVIPIMTETETCYRLLTTSAQDAEAIEHFRQGLGSGQPWFVALLEAMSSWSSPTEVYKGRTYCYLVAGEAFDFLLLARRLLDAVGGMVPRMEVEDLLVSHKLPGGMTKTEVRRLIGPAKYRAYLNYYYGVVVEGCLQGALEREVNKERRASGWRTMSGVKDEAFERIYGSKRRELLGRFRKEKGCAVDGAPGLEEHKEFTYWLFRYRLGNSEKERFASDTGKGINELRRLRTRGIAPTLV